MNRRKNSSLNPRQFGQTVLLACLLGAAALPAAEKQTSLDTLEELVRQWVELKASTAAEKRAWEQQKTHLDAEIRLLKTEQAQRQQEIDTLSRQDTAGSEEQSQRLTQKASMESSLATLGPLLDQAEAALGEWELVIPSPLRVPLQNDFRRLTGVERPVLSIRLQTVLALYAGIEGLQNAIHVVREILPLDNERGVEMDVLYIGLAQGFAVSRDNKAAFIGQPGPGGWAWRKAPDAVKEIRAAMAVANKEQPAALVDLPLRISNEVSPSLP